MVFAKRTRKGRYRIEGHRRPARHTRECPSNFDQFGDDTFDIAAPKHGWIPMTSAPFRGLNCSDSGNIVVCVLMIVQLGAENLHHSEIKE